MLARGQLAQIIGDPHLNPFPDEEDTELAIDKLREKIRFESRGANAFRITYTDTDPDRAKAVTDKLTKMLQDKDEYLRKDQARVTVAFAHQAEGRSDSRAREVRDRARRVPRQASRVRARDDSSDRAGRSPAKVQRSAASRTRRR